MNTSNRNTFSLIQVTAITLMLSVLASCGGGGGGESTSTSTAATTPPAAPAPAPTTTNTSETPTETESYDPDASKQEQTADQTEDLYVEQNFEFNTYKVITIDIQATDDVGAALANTLLFISSLPAEMTELDDERMAEKSLISVFKTDSSGGVYTEVEVSSNVKNVLLELNTLGIENEVIVTLAEDNMVQHHFK